MSIGSVVEPPALVESDVDATTIDDHLDEIAGFLNAQTGRLVKVVRRMLDNPTAWRGQGLETPEKYLAWRLGISTRHGKRLVAMAERADELPETMAAFEAGEISEEQVWPIVRRSPSWADAQSASYAKRMTVNQVEQVMRTYPFDAHDTDEERAARDAVAVDEDSTTDADAGSTPTSSGRDDESTPLVGPADVCWYGQTDDGRWRLHVETDLVAGQIIEAALDERRDHLVTTAAPGEQVTGVDALVALAERSLDGIESPARRQRFRINVLVDPESATVADRLGRVLPASVADQLCCDGIVNPVIVADGLPVSVGRSQRIVPARTRMIIEHRDGGCRAPGCDATHHLEIHHIVHWSEHGPTATWNLVALCGRHHRQHHRGRLGIRGNADDPGGLVFTNADGDVIPDSGARPRPPNGPPPPIAGRWRHPLGERLDTKWFSYHRPTTDDPIGLGRHRHSAS